MRKILLILLILILFPCCQECKQCPEPQKPSWDCDPLRCNSYNCYENNVGQTRCFNSSQYHFEVQECRSFESGECYCWHTIEKCIEFSECFYDFGAIYSNGDFSNRRHHCDSGIEVQ